LATFSWIYRAVSVVSTFANGRFTQDLEGVLVTFPISAITNNTAVDSQYTETEKETERLLANADAANAARNAQNALNRTATTTPGQASSPTTDTTRQNPPTAAPAAPARPPTSSGQPVGNATPTSNTNAQSGGTTQRPADLSRGYTFSEQTFRQKDPAGAKAYNDFQKQKEQEIFTARSASLTAQAQRNNNGTVPPRERELIDQQALTTARRQSQGLAVEKFLPQIQAAGAISFPGAASPAAQQGTAVPRAPQTSSREP
jgi:hypothetical protein